MDERELYFWDLTGYLIVRNVLTSEEVVAANEAIDHFADRIQIGEDNQGARDSETLRGTGRPTLGGLLELPKPYCDPFRKMLAHPAVVMRLNVMCGRYFRLDHGPLLIAGVKGTEGLTLHGSGEPHRPYVAYHHQNDVPYCGGVTVTWQLTDVKEGDGGFVCVPGSHKSQYPMPDGVRTCDDDLGTVVQPAMSAGGILFFMDGAQTHGTHPWQSEAPRRSILFKYAARNSVRSGPARALAMPEVWWNAELVEGMTEVQRAVMYGPYSNHAGAVPFLTVDEDDVVCLEE
ncbi:MAG: phytanoyl-CoA dioxygenase family protein [Candidatus Poribacteria bacterium]|nr:phytanoyl-CoA dioxygenase family protein [Candidatus Poribacteria bacterium]